MKKRLLWGAVRIPNIYYIFPTLQLCIWPKKDRDKYIMEIAVCWLNLYASIVLLAKKEKDCEQ